MNFRKGDGETRAAETRAAEGVKGCTGIESAIGLFMKQASYGVAHYTNSIERVHIHAHTLSFHDSHAEGRGLKRRQSESFHIILDTHYHFSSV